MDARHHLNAVVGYLNLGMLDDAWEELRALPAGEQARPEVVSVRIAILIRMRRWEQALGLSLELCRIIPEHPSPYLDAAFCLHELQRTREARELLLAGPPALQIYGTYHYNMACYETRLGNLHAARDHLGRAIRLDGSYRRMALNDPDLEALRQDGVLPG